MRRSAAQFRADGMVLGVKEQKDGIGSGIGIERAGIQESLDQGVDDGADL